MLSEDNDIWDNILFLKQVQSPVGRPYITLERKLTVTDFKLKKIGKANKVYYFILPSKTALWRKQMKGTAFSACLLIKIY